MDADEVRTKADSIVWFHSIDLGHGVTTVGLSDQNATVRRAQLPSFNGKSVLDIGAWDGYYSYLAERDGAARVVALDHYAWGVDIASRQAYWDECRRKGTLPDQGRDTTDFWRPDLPGRTGFDFAHSVLDSKVEPVVADFTDVDLGSLGAFDVVLYLGVLYHMKEPLTCLERVRAVTKEVAVIETAAICVPRLQDQNYLKFHAGSELNRDFGNWYQPNVEAIAALAYAAGFSRVEVVQGPPTGMTRTLKDKVVRRLARRDQPTVEYRAIVHAFV